MTSKQPVPLTHKTNCYDDEGKLECCCELRPWVESQQTEQISRAEAERLVTEYAVEATAQVLDAISAPAPKRPWHQAIPGDYNELTREKDGYDADDEAIRHRRFD